jgi:ABC-type antimicrobial peptide transport system permease subunit
VVADVRNQGLDREPKKQVYLPLRQSPAASMAVVARTDRDPLAFGAAMRRAVSEVDAEQPIYELSTMDQILARAVFLPRMSATLLALFAGAALLLAALGLYGVLSYVVSLRTREIGLRMALGASGGQTIGLVLRNSTSMVVAGVLIGLVGSILVARAVGGVLYGISPFDLPAFSIAAGALAAAGLIATLIPALRAARVDPMTALREP